MENSTAGVLNVSFRTNTTEEPFTVYEYYYMRQIFAAICVTASVTGIVGNSLVIAAVPLSKKLRTVTNVFVVSLSVSDLLSCLFLPWQAVGVLSKDGWPLPQAYWLCAAASAVGVQGYGCSVNTLAMIAFNRWIGITKGSATKRRVFSHRNIACMVAFSWVMPLCVAVLPPLLGLGELGYEPRYSTCSWVRTHRYSFVQDIVSTLFFFPIQFTIIAFCYMSIFRYVLKTSRRMAQHDAKSISGATTAGDSAMRKKLWKRQIAVTKNLVYIVLAFIICLTPFFIVAITGPNTIPVDQRWISRMTPYAGVFVFCNCCVNPIIYATSHPDFKEAFGYMVRCKFKDIPQSLAQTRRAKMQAVQNA